MAKAGRNTQHMGWWVETQAGLWDCLAQPKNILPNNAELK